VGLYLALGYFGTIPIFHYYKAVGWRAMNWMWLGALLYTAGAVCELTHWPVIVPGWVQSHEVLHICDSLACLCFFTFVVRYVIPYSHEAESVASADSAERTATADASSSEERRQTFVVRDGIVHH
jgi:hypothetical protein